MRPGAAILVSLMFTAALASAPAQRTLSFDERVQAETAIERVYYAHQLGATTAFDKAMPRAAIENKVRKYLEQSAALAAYWKTAVTDASLERELTRMTRGTRMPERLIELFSALGNDSFLIKECLARPALVDRLSRNFYAFDARLHAGTRRRAEELHRQVSSGELNARMPHPNRAVRTLARSEKSGGLARVGEVSGVTESRDAFAFDAALNDTAAGVSVASYTVPKTTWDAWWDGAHRTVRGDAVAAVASDRASLQRPASTIPCSADDTWDNGTLGELPEERTGHTAVWTGTVMVVWGGEGDDGLLNTGGRYDPATDSWMPTSTKDAPSARTLHTAVWNGRVMVVWGGRGEGDDVLDTGGRYDPATDSWMPTSTKDAPEARVAHTAVWTGTEMLVWGGYGGDDLDTGGRYDPDSDAWTPISTTDAPLARHSHVAVWTGDQMVIWGGDGTSDARITGGRYDPASDRWKATSTMGIPDHLGSGCTAVWTGRVMAVWGSRDFGVGANYDPTTDRWTPTSTTGAPSYRTRHTAVWTGTHIIIWGGEGSRGRGVSTGGSYDPASDTWTTTAGSGAPSARAGHTAVWTGSLMLIWGGYGQYDTNGDPATRFNTGGRYDPATDSWTPTSTNGAPSAQRGHTAVWTGTQMVIWGGYLPDRSGRDVNLGARYDPATDSWSATATWNAPSAREHHNAVWTGSRMVVWGGYSDDGPFQSGGRYDPATDSWSPTTTTNAPSARYGHTAVWSGSVMVVWGGFSFPDYLDTGGRYDPVADTWMPTATLGAPAGRDRHTAVWTGSEMVIWGGESDDETFKSGGRYDPANDSWTPTSTKNAPSPNDDHTAVWTGKLMLVWGGYADDPGRYDPRTDTWTTMATTGAPSWRIEHTAIWTGREMVVWGGRGDVDRLDTGGRYDPKTDGWAPTSMTGTPSARRGHTAVWTGDLMLVWGGDSLIDVDRIGRYELGGSVDNDGDGFTECEGDCDDGNAAVHPGAAETCNGIDDDCDGVIDNGGDALCDDGSPCTTDTCDSAIGACTQSLSNSYHPDPKSAAYYKQLCARRALGSLPFPADRLTAADAACVGSLTSTFAGMNTVDELCRAIAGRGRPPLVPRPPGAACINGDDELVAAALNICRARVCGGQQYESLCPGRTLTSVNQSFADADAIFDDAVRDRSACESATCELREINNGDPQRRPAPQRVGARSRL